MPKTENEKFKNSKLSESFTCPKNTSKTLDNSVPKMAKSHESIEAVDNVNENKNKLPEFRDEGKNLTSKHSWSDLLEDDASSKDNTSNEIKDKECETKNSFEENARAHHDSGVVSPHIDIHSNNQIQLPIDQTLKLKQNKCVPSKFEVETDNKAGRGEMESPVKVTNDEERSEIDGGLGSSVCGEDIANSANLADSAAANPFVPAHSTNLPITSHDDTNNEMIKTQTKNQRQATGGSDSGQGSEADDGIRMAYHFYMPNHLCGKLIGKKGETVKQFKNETKCSIQLHEQNDSFQGRFRDNRRYRIREKEQKSEMDPFQLQICIIEGTRNGIDRCLELVREKFPLQQHQELTLEQVNLPQTTSSSSGSLILSTQIDSNGNDDTLLPNAQQIQNKNDSNITAPTQLGLDQGAMHEVYISAIVSGGHAFLQQPNHPTYFALSRLEACMYNVYTRLAVPDVPREVLEPGLVCVTNWSQQWYRVQVVNYDASSDNCYVRFVDYGGYYTFAPSDLKQIRTDFLTLPFQALEVYLGNVIPPDQKDWPVESAVVLEELVTNQIISGRMLGVTEDYIPIVHLYGWVNVDSQDTVNNSQQNQQPRLLNRELVDRGVAVWTEHITAST